MKKHSMQLASEIKVSEELAGERNQITVLPKQITMQANFCLDYFSSFISESISSGKVFEYGRVEDTVSRAKSIGLIKQGDGGISLGSYVSMIALAEAIQVKTYIESGVHKGSSLHAICSQPSVNRIYLLDPNLEKLEFEPEVPTTKLDDLDFAFWSPPQDFIADESLVFFDDHINTANRILQASEKGMRYVVFDDSAGLTSISKKRYPAIPTLPIIMNTDQFTPGDRMEWVYKGTHLYFEVSEKILQDCYLARTKIKKFVQFPSPLTFISQAEHQDEKFLVELN